MRVHMKTCALAAMTLSLLFGSITGADEADLAWGSLQISDDQGRGIAVDDSGNVYVVGWTWSTDFPTTAGAFDTTCNGQDAFVVKLNPTGSALIYATLLGGSDEELGQDIAVDSSGCVYVTGLTGSVDFPATPGAYDVVHNGGAGWRDGFVAKLNATGSALDFATFLGGKFEDIPQSISLDNSGNVFVAGITSSYDFPTTPEAFDRTYNDIGVYTKDGFVAKLNATGSALVYATFLGGNGLDEAIALTIDKTNNAYVTGSTASIDFPTTPGAFDTTNDGGIEWGDVFVVKLNAMGSALDYATFLGGSDDEKGQGIAVDDSGNAYVTGGTGSLDFPVTLGAFDTTYGGGSYYGRDAYIAKLNRSGNALIFATYIGGDADEAGWDIALADFGNACVAGYTESSDFPTTSGVCRAKAFASREVFLVKVDLTGSALEYSTLLGGNNQDRGFDIAIDGSGSAYVTGSTASVDFPTTPGAFDSTYHGGSYWGDAFVAKFNFTGIPLVYATYLGGTSWDTPVVSETLITNLPETYFLHQNYPNPFNANTEIRYQIPEDSYVTLKIFNTLGQEVRALVNAEQKAGEHVVSWDGRDHHGREVASGLYFCRLKAGDLSKNVKMVLVR